MGMAYSLWFRELHEYEDNASGIHVPVVLALGGMEEKTTAKVDTGADLCIFDRDHGEALGIDIESGIRQEVRTANGLFLTYGHTVSLKALSFELPATVYFAAEPDFPRNVLGRRGWIDRLRVGIVDYERKLYVSYYDDET